MPGFWALPLIIMAEMTAAGAAELLCSILCWIDCQLPAPGGGGGWIQHLRGRDCQLHRCSSSLCPASAQHWDGQLLRRAVSQYGGGETLVLVPCAEPADRCCSQKSTGHAPRHRTRRALGVCKRKRTCGETADRTRRTRSCGSNAAAAPHALPPLPLRLRRASLLAPPALPTPPRRSSTCWREKGWELRRRPHLSRLGRHRGT